MVPTKVKNPLTRSHSHICLVLAKLVAYDTAVAVQGYTLAVSAIQGKTL